MRETLRFPDQRPPEYIKLENEPIFDAAKHLQLEAPESVTSLDALGYSEMDTQDCPSGFGVSSAFRILSEEGLSVMRDVCLKMYDNRNISVGTGVNRLGSYVPGRGVPFAIHQGFLRQSGIGRTFIVVSRGQSGSTFRTGGSLRRELRPGRYYAGGRQLAHGLGRF